MRTWLSADHHFGHTNIIKYCHRPFNESVQMDDELISIWNTNVAPLDEVYYLGDLTLTGKEGAGYYLARLNGQIKILSNPWHHDGRWLNKLGDVVFKSRPGVPVEILQSIVILENIYLNEDSQSVPAVLCHYPFEVWDRKHYGSFHFHGHSHGMLPKMHNRLDIGIDNIYRLTAEYRPIELAEAIGLAAQIPE